MNSKYITCYRRNGNKITIYISDKRKIECTLKNNFLNINNNINSALFAMFGINKWVLARKLPYKYTHGDWPECEDQKGTIALLNALIKESKIRYYEHTEI